MKWLKSRLESQWIRQSRAAWGLDILTVSGRIMSCIRIMRWKFEEHGNQRKLIDEKLPENSGKLWGLFMTVVNEI